MKEQVVVERTEQAVALQRLKFMRMEPLGEAVSASGTAFLANRDVRPARQAGQIGAAPRARLRVSGFLRGAFVATSRRGYCRFVRLFPPRAFDRADRSVDVSADIRVARQLFLQLIEDCAERVEVAFSSSASRKWRRAVSFRPSCASTWWFAPQAMYASTASSSLM